MPAPKAISQALSTVIVIVIILAALLGYVVGATIQKASTFTSTSTVTTTSYLLTTSTISETNSCTLLSSVSNIFLLLGFQATVAYQGNWSVYIATFASQTDNASALTNVCQYDGSGTETFYMGLANYSGGWSTMVVLAHKLGTNGTLSVQASIGNQTSTSTTTQDSNSATVSISFLQ